MGKEQRVIYYHDELNDEFADDNIVPKKIDENYMYIKDGLCSRIGHVFWYRIIATPLAKIYMKLHFHHKIINKAVLKGARKQPYFMFGNHTHFIADALVPTMVNMPKDVSIIVHPNNVSMPFLGRITPYLGALPLPDDIKAAKNFMLAIQRKIEENKCVMIYPEAHIWPFYTDIRPFTDLSFRYPVQYKTAVYCLTNTYQKRRFSKKPKLVTYVDGPFRADDKLPQKEQKKQLRDAVYRTMKERAKLNELCLVRYEKI